MRTKVQRWGNSLAVRIPKPFAEEVGLDQSSTVDVSLLEGALRILPIREPAWTLEALLAEVNEENLHSEVDSGPPVGREAW